MKTISFDDAMIDRCCLYLLAEMPAEQAVLFEQEATQSDSLRACLWQQAELISALGTAWPGQATMPVVTAVGGPQREVLVPPRPAVDPPRPASGRSLGGWAAGLAIALAASLLLLLTWDRSTQRQPESTAESVQLAHAWAAARSEGASLESATATMGAGDETDGLPHPSDMAASPEGPPEWLIVAVRAAEAESGPTVESGEVDDG